MAQAEEKRLKPKLPKGEKKKGETICVICLFNCAKEKTAVRPFGGDIDKRLFSVKTPGKWTFS